jgi:hypothetical protein
VGAPQGYNGPGIQIAPDVLSLQTLIANVCFWGRPGAPAGEWVLIDAGLANSGGQLQKVAAERFGTDSRPAAIILTHGHFIAVPDRGRYVPAEGMPADTGVEQSRENPTP